MLKFLQKWTRFQITCVTCCPLRLYLRCFCMGYQALLFCPDEKTARTVTQVLSELEFAVETCAEPFAAVKKLMGEHFDAIVVDCDNEQNATLLFKSARNSTSNQASLAVAVVEGQAGVAKAFRIGANLVLTKPINVEQAKGTLRVARGLLRKGEPGKPAAATPVSAAPTTTPAPAAAAAPAAAPAKPTAPKPPATVQNVAPPQARSPLPPVPRPVAPPVPAMPPQVAVASTKPTAADEDLLDINNDAPAPVVAAVPPAPKPAPVHAPVAEVKLAPSAAVSASGAASAPAPAREVPQPAVTPKAPAADSLFEKPAPAPAETSISAAPAPSFTFGGAAVPEEPSGSGKKIGIGVAAAVVFVVGGYFVWSHFQGSKSAAPVSSAPVTASQPVTPSTSAPAPAATSAPASPAPSVSQPVARANEPAAAASETASEEDQPAPEKETTSSKAASGKSSASPKASPAPLMVKGGAEPSIRKAPAADAPAPSVIGMAVPATAAPPVNLGTANIVAPKPVLQTLNISQGVSRGLLIKKVQPNYPQNALAMHVEGEVELMATISKQGNITSVKVISGEQLLTRAATEAVKQWKYKPYLLNGEPVEIQTQITVNFRLPH